MTSPKTVVALLEELGRPNNEPRMAYEERMWSVLETAQAIHQYYMSRIPKKIAGCSEHPLGYDNMRRECKRWYACAPIGSYNQAIDRTIAAFEGEE